MSSSRGVRLLCGLSLWATSTLIASERPKVHLVATGGTIANGSSLEAQELQELVPGLDAVADVTGEDFLKLGSSRMTPELQFRLARRVRQLFRERPELSGIVVTHGTDSLEESAFFLDLLGSAVKPVVFVGAMRQPRETGTDGPRNLLNAVRLAAAKGARGLGVLVTLNDEIHGARDLRKVHSIAVNAFASPGVGPLGRFDGEHIYLFHRPARRLELDVHSVEPRVSLIRLAAGSDGSLVRAAIASRQRGIVLEVFGRGNVPPKVGEAVREAREKGIIVVFTTRTGGGRVELDDGPRRLGVINGGDLDGLKARIVLVAALGTTHDRGEISSYYEKLAGELAAN